MALESFYGGKQGVSPVIKARFEYIDKKDKAYQNRLENRYTIPTKKELMRLRAIGYEIIVNDDGTLQINSPDTSKLENINVRTNNNKTQIEWTEKLLSYFTMNECFKRVDYTDVWYGELCIIDTQNKLNPNNGKIFRRTLKRYQNPNLPTTDQEALYAEYIGQIVGPSGGIPNLDLGSLDAERQKAIGALPTFDGDPKNTDIDTTNWDYMYPTEEIENGEPTGKTILTSEHPENINEIAILKMGDGSNIEMVPGKVTDQNNNINYNDTIEYTWCNVRRNLDNSDEDSAWIYLGFKIPYVSYDVKGYEENYTYNEDVFIDNSSTPNSSLGSYHPFSKEYEFHIPRGARGIGPEEIFIVGKDGKTKPNKLYSFDAIKYNQDNDTFSVKSNAEPIEATDLPKTYWVAKINLYNPKKELNEAKDTVYLYIGSYKEIDTIEVNVDQDDEENYGQISAIYSDSDDKVPINYKLPLIKNIRYNNEGKLVFTMVGPDIDHNIVEIVTDGTIKELSSMKIDKNTGEIFAHYTSGPQNENDPGYWIKIGDMPTLDNVDITNILFNSGNPNDSSTNINKLEFIANPITVSTNYVPLDKDWWTYSYPHNS